MANYLGGILTKLNLKKINNCPNRKTFIWKMNTICVECSNYLSIFRTIHVDIFSSFQILHNLFINSISSKHSVMANHLNAIIVKFHFISWCNYCTIFELFFYRASHFFHENYLVVMKELSYHAAKILTCIQSCFNNEISYCDMILQVNL